MHLPNAWATYCFPSWRTPLPPPQKKKKNKSLPPKTKQEPTSSPCGAQVHLVGRLLLAQCLHRARGALGVRVHLRHAAQATDRGTRTGARSPRDWRWGGPEDVLLLSLCFLLLLFFWGGDNLFFVGLGGGGDLLFSFLGDPWKKI